MKRFNPVLVYAGTPPLLTFSSADGTPIVIDNTTNKAYYNNAGTVTQIAGGGGGGTVTSVTGTSPVVSSGGATPAISLLGLTGLGSALQVVRTNAAATALEYATLSGGGTVTSVGVGSTGSTLTVTGSPVTGSGTINADFNLGHRNEWTATQNVGQVALTDAATITPNGALSNNFYLLMTAGVGSTRTINVPTSLNPGDKFNLEIQQPATGGPCASVFAAGYTWGSGGSASQPIASSGASASEFYSCTYLNAGNVRAQMAGSGGPTGAGYGGTSITSQGTGTGSKTFATQAGKAWLPTQRVRAGSASTGEFMEGPITSYGAGSMVIAVDYNTCTTTHTDWNISATGQLGTQGIQGIAGPAGSGNGVNLQTGTTYTYITADASKLVSHANASAMAASLPQATGSFGSPFVFDVESRGPGTLTITPTISTIDGGSTLVLQTGQGCRIFSDGTNWYTQRGVGGSSSTAHAFAAYLSTTQTLTANTDTKVVFDTTEIDTDSAFSTTLHKYIIPSGGPWNFSFTASTSAGVAGSAVVSLQIWKNGAKVKIGTYLIGFGANTYDSMTCLLQCSASDVIEFYVNINGTNVLGGSANTYCAGFLVH